MTFPEVMEVLAVYRDYCHRLTVSDDPSIISIRELLESLSILDMDRNVEIRLDYPDPNSISVIFRPTVRRPIEHEQEEATGKGSGGEEQGLLHISR